MVKAFCEASSLYLGSLWCFCPTGRRNYSVQSQKGQQSRPSIPAAEAGDGFSSEPVIEDIRKTKTNRWEKRRSRPVALLAFCGALQASDDGESCPTLSLTVHSTARLISRSCLAPVRTVLETATLSLFRLTYMPGRMGHCCSPVLLWLRSLSSDIYGRIAPSLFIPIHSLIVSA